MKIFEKEMAEVKYSAAAIKILRFEIKPMQSCFRTHWHDRMEILRIKKGEMILDIATKTVTVKPGELVILPPKTIHKGYSAQGKLEYDVLMFDIRTFYNETDICQKYLPAIFDGRAKFVNVTSNNEVISCFDRICNELDADSLAANTAIYQFVDQLVKNCLLNFYSKIESSIAFEMIKFLEENFKTEINSRIIGNRFGYTYSHLCRKFKAATGLAPMTYLKIYRLEKACKLLKNGANSVSKISSECGFSDANYFARSFKSHFGVCPTFYKSKKIIESIRP